MKTNIDALHNFGRWFKKIVSFLTLVAILTGDEYFSLYESEVPYLTRTAVFALYGVTVTNLFSVVIYFALVPPNL